MNLQKFTKAELISKLNKLKSTNNNNGSSRIVEFLLSIKKLILSITFIALFFKIFKKYWFLRAIFSGIN
jgi:hypothetical protein